MAPPKVPSISFCPGLMYTEFDGIPRNPKDSRVQQYYKMRYLQPFKSRIRGSLEKTWRTRADFDGDGTVTDYESMICRERIAGRKRITYCIFPKIGNSLFTYVLGPKSGSQRVREVRIGNLNPEEDNRLDVAIHLTDGAVIVYYGKSASQAFKDVEAYRTLLSEIEQKRGAK